MSDGISAMFDRMEEERQAAASSDPWSTFVIHVPVEVSVNSHTGEVKVSLCGTRTSLKP